MDFKPVFTNFFLLLFFLLLSYITYSFLTFAIISCFASLVLFDTTFTNGMLTAQVLKLFSFTNPIFAEGSYSAGMSEIMDVYFIISLLVFIISLVISCIYRLITKKTVSLSLKAKILRGVFVVFVIHLIGFISAFFASYAEGRGKGGMFIILSIFFILSILSVVIYIFISEKIRIFKEKIFVTFSKIE
jgi:hypothetical protein